MARSSSRFNDGSTFWGIWGNSRVDTDELIRVNDLGLCIIHNFLKPLILY